MTITMVRCMTGRAIGTGDLGGGESMQAIVKRHALNLRHPRFRPGLGRRCR